MKNKIKDGTKHLNYTPGEFEEEEQEYTACLSPSPVIISASTISLPPLSI